MDADKAREVLERWPGYERQSWPERFAELDLRTKETQLNMCTAIERYATKVATARTDALREAAERLEAHATVMEGPHIVQNRTAKAMATATRDCASIVRSLIKEPKA